MKLDDEGQLPKSAFDAANDANPTPTSLSRLFFVPDEEHSFEQGNVGGGFAEADKIMEFKARRRWHTWAQPELPTRYHEVERRISGAVGKTPARVRAQAGHVLLVRTAHEPHHHPRALSGRHVRRMELDELEHGHPLHHRAAEPEDWARPVKLVFNRRDDFYGGSMDCAVHRFKVGVKNDGTITAVAIKSIFSNGPKAPEPDMGIGHFLENSRIPNLFKAQHPGHRQ